MVSKIILTAACLLLVAFVCSDAKFVGGLDEEREADETVRKVVNSVLTDLTGKHNYSKIEPISYRRQVVSGFNYFIKARAFKEDGSKSIVHLRVYQPFRGANELSAIKHNLEETHKLEYFS